MDVLLGRAAALNDGEQLRLCTCAPRCTANTLIAGACEPAGNSIDIFVVIFSSQVPKAVIAHRAFPPRTHTAQSNPTAHNLTGCPMTYRNVYRWRIAARLTLAAKIRDERRYLLNLNIHSATP
jgi:hypothetical protein